MDYFFCVLNFIIKTQQKKIPLGIPKGAKTISLVNIQHVFKEPHTDKGSDSELDSRFWVSASLNCVSSIRGKRSHSIIMNPHACVKVGASK